MKKLFKNEKGEIVDKVFFDGYPFGDRLLEDVTFQATIKDNKVKVEITKDCANYFSDLNQKKWLGIAKNWVEEMSEGEEYLTDEKGLICDLIKEGIEMSENGKSVVYANGKIIGRQG